MRKNVSSQVIAFQMVSTTDGSAVTSGTPAVYVTIDGGTQATGTGTATHKGYGQWTYAPSQAETNGNHVAFTMELSGAVCQCVQVYPVSYDPTDAVRLGMTALPNAAPEDAGGLVISSSGDNGDIDDLTTNAATTASRLTAARAGYLDNLNGHTPQTGDSFARIGANGSALTDLATSSQVTNQNDLDSSQVQAACAAAIAAEEPIAAELTHIQGHALAGTGTQLADGFEFFFNVGTPAKTLNDVGVAGSGLTSAQVQTACEAAIAAEEPIAADLTHIQGHALAGTGTQLADAFETFFNVSDPLSMSTAETLLRLAASAVGAVTVTNNGTTLTLSFKDTDGSTEVRNLTYTLATGARSQN